MNIKEVLKENRRNERRVEPLVYTANEFAQLFKISKSHVYALLNSGKLPSLTFGAKKLITKKTVDAVIEGRLIF